jgi:protein-S-isoprenylcysteine O-methyltransferase Ste14
MSVSLVQILLLFSFTACFSSFNWACFRFFRTFGRPCWAIANFIAAYVSTVLHVIILVCMEPTGTKAYISLALYALSFCLFWSSIVANRERPLRVAFCPPETDHIVQVGPYGYVRHPLYLSYSLAWAAGALASDTIVLWFTVVMMISIYLWAAKYEENSFLASPWEREYRDYMQKTGMVIPWRLLYLRSIWSDKINYRETDGESEDGLELDRATPRASSGDANTLQR